MKKNQPYDKYTSPEDLYRKKSEKKSWTIIALLVLVYVLFSTWMGSKPPTSGQQPVDQQNASELTPAPENLPASSQESVSKSEMSFSNTSQGRHTGYGQKDSILLKNEWMELEVDPQYGTIKNALIHYCQAGFKNRQDCEEEKRASYEITPKIHSQNYLPLEYVLASGRLGDKDINSQREFESLEYSPVASQKKNTLMLEKRWNGMRIRLQYELDPQTYGIKHTVEIANLTAQNQDVIGSLFWGGGLGPFIPKEEQSSYDRMLKVAYYDLMDKDEVILDKNEDVLASGKYVDYFSMDNRYFAVAFMNAYEENRQDVLQQSQVMQQYLFHPDGEGYPYLQWTKEMTVRAQETRAFSTYIYLGPKDKKALQAISVPSHVAEIMERGFFVFPAIGQFLMWILGLFYTWFHSYGLAIVFFSILLKAIFYPLNKKNLVVMQKNTSMQQKVKSIQQRYPDKKVQQVKIAELYKQEKFNPISGCLPMLVQLPFFIAFYQTLPGLIQLSHASFLWIKDLSSPDTIFLFPSFFFLPRGFHLLPVLIAIITFIQTKQSPQTKDNPNAQLMAYLMPMLFLFMLWNAPSGLTLYWFFQTVLGYLQQWQFQRTIAKRKEIEEKKAQGSKG